MASSTNSNLALGNLLTALQDGSVVPADVGSVKARFGPALKLSVSDSAKQKNAIGREHMKDALAIANMGLEGLNGSVSSVEPLLDIVQITLGVLENFQRCQLLKGSPLQLERMWFTFAQRALARGASSRAAGSSNHLLLMLAARDAPNLPTTFEDYLPVAGDSPSRIYMSACAFVTFCKAVAEASPQKLLVNSAWWTLAREWIAKIDDSTKRSACGMEYATLMVMVIHRLAAAKCTLKNETPSFIEAHTWAKVLFALLHDSHQEAAALMGVETSLQKFAQMEPPNDVFFTAVAKKIEEIRKACGMGDKKTKDEAISLSKLFLEYSGFLITGAEATNDKRLERLIPFAIEALGTACLLRALSCEEIQEAHDILQRFEASSALDKASTIALSSKYYNVGVALYHSGKAVPFFESCCCLLRGQLCKGDTLPASFAEKHRVLSTSAELDGNTELALEAALWSFWADQGNDLAAERVVLLVERFVPQERSLEQVFQQSHSLLKVSTKGCRSLMGACYSRPQVHSCLVSLILGAAPDIKVLLVDRARLLRSQGKTNEAIELLAGRTDFESSFWREVLLLENGCNRDASLVAFHEAITQATESDCGHLEAARHFFEWIGEHTLALESLEVAQSLVPSTDRELVIATLRGCEVATQPVLSLPWAEYLMSQFQLDEAFAAASQLCQQQRAHPWVVAMCQCIRAECAWLKGDQNLALQSSILSMQAMLAACHFGTCDRLGAWLDATNSQWTHLNCVVKVTTLCGLIHENLGLALEAEYIWGKSSLMCATHLGSVQKAKICALMCSVAINRKSADANQHASELASLRERIPTSALVSSLCQEVVGDQYFAAGDAFRAYDAFVRAKHGSLNSRMQSTIDIKAGLALEASGNKAGAELVWRSLLTHRDPYIVRRVQYHLACLSEDAALLKDLALAKSPLDVRFRRCAAAFAATLSLEQLDQARCALFSAELAPPPPSLPASSEEREVVDDLTSALNGLHMGDSSVTVPSDWTIVSLSIVRSQGTANALLISRTEGSDPNHPTVRVLRKESFARDLEVAQKELSEIILESDASTKRSVLTTKEKKQWWDDRKNLDRRLKTLLHSMETTWFGSERSLLRPQSAVWTPSSAVEALKTARSKIATLKRRKWTPEKIDARALARVACAAALYLDHELVAALGSCCGDLFSPKECATLCEHFRTACSAETEPSAPLILIVGPGLEAFPWESLPSLRGCSTTRMPSMRSIQVRLQAQAIQLHQVNHSSGYFILNPSSDLKKTQETFESSFRDKRGWTGISGIVPTGEQFAHALTNYDIFVFCGHNSGEQYLRKEQMEKLVPRVKPVTLLMGCSSAKLRDLGLYEPAGVVLSYINSQCPLVVGNLWDVTDADIDRYLSSLLEQWLDEGAHSGSEGVLSCIARARDQCVLKYLIGAAVVTWGLPCR